MKRFTKQEDSIIKAMFLDNGLKQIADKIGRSLGSVYGRCKTLGLQLTPELKLKRKMIGIEAGWRYGEKTRFRKGHIPSNKGKKMSPELYAKCKHTFFQNGEMPHNYVEIGSTTVTPDGYIKIKIAEPKKWKFLHRLNWEKQNGPIPKGMIVAFKDNNKSNCEHTNLELITRRENMKRNSIHNYPEEIVRATMTIGRLTREINKQTKN